MKIKQHNSKWPYIPDHPYRILIIQGSGSGKTNSLLKLIISYTLIKYTYMQKIHMKKKYQFLINKRESTGLKHFNNPKAFIEYSIICKMFLQISRSTIQVKKVKVFVDMIAEMINNNNLIQL